MIINIFSSFTSTSKNHREKFANFASNFPPSNALPSSTTLTLTSSRFWETRCQFPQINSFSGPAVINSRHCGKFPSAAWRGKSALYTLDTCFAMNWRGPLLRAFFCHPGKIIFHCGNKQARSSEFLLHLCGMRSLGPDYSVARVFSFFAAEGGLFFSPIFLLGEFIVSKCFKVCWTRSSFFIMIILLFKIHEIDDNTKVYYFDYNEVFLWILNHEFIPFKNLKIL